MGRERLALQAALSGWSADERHRFRAVVGWAHRTKPRTWNELRDKFAQMLPSRTEEDLLRVCQALRQDMPSMPLPMPEQFA